MKTNDRSPLAIKIFTITVTIRIFTIKFHQKKTEEVMTNNYEKRSDVI